jgi:hypothetical protein
LLLQWGHVVSDVEMAPDNYQLVRYFLLQWGHVVSDVEIAPM